jgi:acetyl esterase/lipase
VTERVVEDIYIYDIQPHGKPADRAVKRIYYFSGGGWQTPPSNQHWQLCAELSSRIPEVSISLVSYPLAPKNPAPLAFPMLLKLYRVLMQDSKEAGETVILAGDSSGGNIVLSLALEALREDAESREQSKGASEDPWYPRAILAISPSIDLTRSNSDIEKLNDYDPLLTPDFVKSTAKAWQGDWDATDSRLSPINSDLSLLRKAGVKVHGVIGSYDILSPDAIKFRDRCAAEGVRGCWLQWDKQIHCFPLTFGYGVPEAAEAISWMVNVIKTE